jgi:hypothetical protein
MGEKLFADTEENLQLKRDSEWWKMNETKWGWYNSQVITKDIRQTDSSRLRWLKEKKKAERGQFQVEMHNEKEKEETNVEW